jgi:long-chain acyl-CoA synthetase
MANPNIVLLTGANGFIGSQIAKRLLKQTNTKIIALVNAKNNIEAKNRLCKAWWDWPELHDSISNKTIPLAADVRKKKLGLSENQYEDLTKSLTHIIHCAAKWRFDTEIEELHQTNVEGTKNIIALTKLTHENHEILRLSYISSAYVSGKIQGNISEETLTDKYGFITEYEQTKFKGEKLVQLEKNNLPISIFRPTMVIGDSKTGEITTFNTVYTLLRLYLLGKLRYLPINPSTRINIVPVDYVANTITKLTFSESAVGLTFHLTPKSEDLPTVREFADSVQKWVNQNLKISLPKMILFSLPNKLQTPLIMTWAKLTNNSKYAKLMDALSFYFQTNQTFERTTLEKLTGDYKFDWQKLVSPILKYAVKHGFLHRTERTVHEQILFRLNSRTMPVNLFDITEEKFVHRPNKKVRKEIFKISSALQNMGIRKGDLVALIGFNSVRYLALDVAIGLIGAVSVPLYYTSASTEIERIIKTSKAKILFIGTPKLLETISKIDLSIPIINFCRKQSINKNPNIISWAEFIQIKTNKRTQTFFPSLTFSDLSTIRYTAGSTGENKGVCFNHAHIRWLAETVSSLFPWEVRNKEVTYLSFLPLNHVVEGIIGAYSPFYEPTEINLYFLENFYELQKMLPEVRPVVFFSVPRFYEKVWEAFRKTKLGKSYLDSRNQIKKKILRKFLKKTILKKTGLDRCIQLIVGSAPCREKLLLDFRDLEIEVYNAYGLTEAPLVTINRLGKNHIGSVGQPLPQTELKEGKDGELLVKGPQVMLGYLNEEITNNIENGWLHTGDLGKINKDGDLIIYGRKKELIATSYGKMISPFKIESMLKGLEGVEEAMIIGEGQPYVSALIWSNEAEKQPETVNIINQGIEKVNSNLSRAEQIRTWAILKNNLRVESKDLTPNLKLRRPNICNRFTNIIESLYNQKNVIDTQIIEISRTEN